MNLISKKDLLAVTGISYGQLYRWKRQRLIPDEWFLKRSSYTGQETFFPREQMLSRIQSILVLKDQYSMEELAKILSPETSDTSVSIEELGTIAELKDFLPMLPALFGKERYDFSDIVILLCAARAAKSSGLLMPQIEALLRECIPAASRQKKLDRMCCIFFADGNPHIVFTKDTDELVFDNGIEKKACVSMNETASELKLDYQKIFTD